MAKIKLPKGCFTVIADKAKEKTESGIILSEAEVIMPDTGTIAYTSDETERYIGHKIRFRPHFGELLDIEGVPHIYFRDFDSSVFYIIEN